MSIPSRTLLLALVSLFILAAVPPAPGQTGPQNVPVLTLIPPNPTPEFGFQVQARYRRTHCLMDRRTRFDGDTVRLTAIEGCACPAGSNPLISLRGSVPPSSRGSTTSSSPSRAARVTRSVPRKRWSPGGPSRSPPRASSRMCGSFPAGQYFVLVVRDPWPGRQPFLEGIIPFTVRPRRAP